VPARQFGDFPRPVRRPARVRLAWLWSAAALVLVTAISGCAKFDAALGQQWAVVHFNPTTSVATLLTVRAACSHVPNVSPEALPKSRNPADMIYSVRYRTDNATDADLARLQQCLQRFPAVAGIDFEDSGDAG
jgi:hypothetical protein